MMFGSLRASSALARQRLDDVDGLPCLGTSHSAHGLDDTGDLVVVGGRSLAVQPPHQIFERHTEAAGQLQQRL
jgi:hypothetical protein